MMFLLSGAPVGPKSSKDMEPPVPQAMMSNHEPVNLKSVDGTHVHVSTLLLLVTIGPWRIVAFDCSP